MFLARRCLFPVMAAVVLVMCHVDPARAAAIQLNGPSELSIGDTIVTYPTPLPNPAGFSLTAGGFILTFSTPGLFSVLDSDGVSFDYPAGTTLLANNLQSGPLTIAFSTGVREVGFFAQSFAFDVEEFSFSVQGASPLGTFTAGPADNAFFPGIALFIGARATGGDLITRLTVGETSNSDFVIGPLAFGKAIAAEPVPEPGTLVLLGSGLIYGARRLRRRSA